MVCNKLGLDLIKSFEGLRLEPYDDGAGYMTIGYGHLIKKGEKFSRITKAEAEALLLDDLQIAEKGVRDNVNVSITSNQFSALVSFSFNVGVRNFKRSTLLRLINSGVSGPRIAAAFLSWTRAGGKQMAGLVRRRMAEIKLYNTRDI